MSMTDRVARAIHIALPPMAISGAPVAWDDLSDEARTGYLQAARRAISTMRLPSDAMMREGERRDLARDAANIWERMIFTALSESI